MINLTRRLRHLVCWLLLSLACPAGAGAQAVVVGGKDFTEQLIMAEMTHQLLSAKGFATRLRTGLSTRGVRLEQEAGLIDVYWEYTGTALLVFNAVREKLGPEAAHARVRKLDAAKGLVWLTPSRVDNTYALAMRRADAVERGIASISDLAAQVRSGESFQVGVNTEFYTRMDGLLPLQQAYRFGFGRENVVRMETETIYDRLRDRNQLDVGLVFSTDGRVAAFDFVLLRDDLRFFPSYLLTPVVREKVLAQNPQLAAPLNALAGKLDNATIAELNAAVDLNGRTVEEVARSFLVRSGLL
jgi:osmoprotectant transport system substrate-binding protein